MRLWIGRVFSWIARAYNWVTGKIDNLTASWVHDLISGLYGFLHTIFGTVIHAWDRFVNAIRDVRSAITSFANQIVHAWHYLWRVYIPGLLRWIDIHILRPLLNAWHWITHEGSTLWYYITHPGKLVDLIWDDVIAKLERESWNVAEKLGKFFLSLIARNLDKVAKLIEDVLNAVF